METQTETDWVDKIGEPAYSAVAEMVAALNVDRDRLEELRDEREDWVDNIDGDEDEQDRTAEDWAKEFPEEAEELAELEAEAGDTDNEGEARERIEEDALSVRVFGERRGGEWEAQTYELLLGTGGPAIRIVGDLNRYGEPGSARLEVQDWFKPWTEHHAADSDVLLAYASCFYLGE